MAAPVTIPYARYSIESAQWWIGRALGALVAKAGIKASDIDGLCVSSFTMGPDSGIGLTQHFGLCVRWLDTIPLGGASAIAALRRAARAVQAHDADIVACVAGDTNHVDSFRLTLENFSRFNQDAVYPYGSGGANASFAFLTAYYMRTYGAKPEDFGKLCVAQRANALKFPHALMRKPLTLEEYMASPMISEPLCLYDCDIAIDGATAVVISDAAHAPDVPNKAIHFEAVGSALHGRASWDQWEDFTTMSGRDAAAISSAVAGGSSPRSSVMFRHMTSTIGVGGAPLR